MYSVVSGEVAIRGLLLDERFVQSQAECLSQDRFGDGIEKLESRNATDGSGSENLAGVVFERIVEVLQRFVFHIGDRLAVDFEFRVQKAQLSQSGDLLESGVIVRKAGSDLSEDEESGVDGGMASFGDRFLVDADGWNPQRFSGGLLAGRHGQ